MINSKVYLLLDAGPGFFLISDDQRVIPVPDIHFPFFQDLIIIKKIDLAFTFFGFFLLFGFRFLFGMEFLGLEAKKQTLPIFAP
jgi:hypothetical protein